MRNQERVKRTEKPVNPAMTRSLGVTSPIRPIMGVKKLNSMSKLYTDITQGGRVATV